MTIIRKDLLNVLINHTISSIEIKAITMSPGQVGPKHFHPCPVVGYVATGSVFFQIEGKEHVIIRAGEGFYEPKNKTILHFDNASKDQPLTFIAFYLKKGQEENIKTM